MGDVTLVVNVASEWGLTKQNYNELVQLHAKYAPQGLKILAFPCNQFGSQEPKSAVDVVADMKRIYGAEFPIYDKIDVNGDNAHPLFKYLQNVLSGFPTNAIKWNFTKFLCIRGVPTKRYAPTSSPLSFESDIVAALTSVTSKQ